MTAGPAAIADQRVGGVAVSVLGAGSPVTVFAHGLGGGPLETRPLAARVPGTRVLLTFRGHGASDPLPGGWSYDDLAADLLAVADAFEATRAVGLSLGAGALLRVLREQPQRFARLGFVLPATLDRGRQDQATERLLRLADAVIAADEPTVVRLLLEDVPPMVRGRTSTRLIVDRRARHLLASRPPYPRDSDPPLADLRPLRAVQAPAIVVSQAGDPLHPADVATRLAAALPHAELLALEPGGVFWTAARQAQDALARHLDPESP